MTAHVVTQALFLAGEALGKVANVMDQADCFAINPQPRPQANLKRWQSI
jgi:hypothetical protein